MQIWINSKAQCHCSMSSCPKLKCLLANLQSSRHPYGCTSATRAAAASELHDVFGTCDYQSL